MTTTSDNQSGRARGMAALIPQATGPLPEGLVVVTPALLEAVAAVLDGHGDPYLAGPAAAMATVLRAAAHPTPA